MILNQKCQYAVRAVFELAKRQGQGPVPAARVAEAQCIPVRFLENILAQLRQAGVVDSVRGKEGGYRLARPALTITVGEVIRLIQGPIGSTDCGEPHGRVGLASRAGNAGIASRAGNAGVGASGGPSVCPLRAGCVLLPMWDTAHRAMMDVFDGTTFGDLVDEERAAKERDVIDYAI